jgi:hypothetical protein
MAVLNLGIGYLLADIACNVQSRLFIHIFEIFSVSITAYIGWISWRQWVALGEAAPGQMSGPLGSRRFMALVGWIGAIGALLLIVSQWFPVFVVGPCIRT